jgi:hypothetical protein
MEGQTVYKIRPSAGKGLGIFATASILRGHRIIREKPLMTAPLLPDVLSSWGIHDRFSRLDTADQERYLQLHASQAITDLVLPSIPRILPPSFRDHTARVVSIFRTNAFRLQYVTDGGEIEDGTEGVFSIASRINHSCCPNAGYTWNSNLDSVTIHAIKDIAVGEEITISYVLPTMDLFQRWSALDGYGFVCHCPACTDPVRSASRERRELISRLNEDLGFYDKRNAVVGVPSSGPLSSRLVDGSGVEKPLSVVQELVDLLIAEGLVGHELVHW